MINENLRWINECARTGKGMDVIIVSTDNRCQEVECQRHLEGLLGDLIKPTAKVVAVCEDWAGGAGNGLGTLYAYLKAQHKLQKLYGVDLRELQKRGSSIAIYHTAGQGKRLSPLTGSEHNSKSAVKLPATFGKQKRFMTILDAVLKQTALFSQSRKGRLSVFWGDQVFIPSKVINGFPTHHVEIFIQQGKWPNNEAWRQHRWGQYGVVSFDDENNALLFEKPDFTFMQQLKQKGLLLKSIGKSLGCFSLSAPLTFALLDLFKEELHNKQGKLDTDPSFWMASTLPSDLYLEAVHNPSKEHHQRMQAFKEGFMAQNKSLPFFGMVDIGAQSLWWDYGSADQYFANQLKLVELTPEGDGMRTFFGLKLDRNTQSIILDSNTPPGAFKRSVIVGSSCEQFQGEECVFINSTIRDGTGKTCLLYNVQENEPLHLASGAFRADAFIEDRHVKLITQLGRDGKADWSHRLPQNALSYEDVYQLNQSVCR